MRGKKPTGAEMASEAEINQMAHKYWSPDKSGSQLEPFDPQVVEHIYESEIKGTGFNVRRIMALEVSQYLESYLWPNFSLEKSSVGHLMSIVVMVNEKFRERVSPWDAFKKSPLNFPDFFYKMARISLQVEEEEKLRIMWKERTALLVFFTHCVNSVEIDLIREQIQKYISLPIWVNLSERRREKEFTDVPKLRKFWASLQKKDALLDPNALQKVNFERKFIVNMISHFYRILALIPNEEEAPKLDKIQYEMVHFCERFLVLFVDIEALLPTRRFFNVVLDDCHVVVSCKKSSLSRRPGEGRLFTQLLDMLMFYARFEIDDITGEALTDQEMTKNHYNKMMHLQKLIFKNFPRLKQFYMSNIAAVNTRQALMKHFQQLNDEELIRLCDVVGLGQKKIEDEFDRNLILELIAFLYEKVPSQLQSLNEMPLYPTDAIIWDENIVPSDFFSGDACLALPKLNLQFLTLHDYLLRNFHLFRLESTYEIRQDIEDAVSRMKPWKTEDGAVMFGGWARMALAIDTFTVVEVRKPNIGENQPSRVRAEIRVNLSVKKEIRREWESLRKHDVCFLVTVRPNCPPGTSYKFKEPFIPQVGLTYVRGCEVQGMLDPQGKLIEEGSGDRPYFDTDFRTYRVWLDCNQYAVDMDETAKGEEDIYDSFNLIVRRKPKENNFKAVLETIRDLMNTKCVVPEWLHDVILGYGDPGAAHYSKMSNQIKNLDFNDTFLSFDHLKSCFPGHEIESTTNEPCKLVPPFKVNFVDDKKLVVTPYVLPNRGPYPFEQPKKNSVRFTPTQVEAIKAGMEPGLTMVVGPPGTGKTDVAVQIIANIYHNFPDQRTIIVTHSNQALNQLFEKIMCLDIDERHLLRLGHGEEELETEKDFSRYGRVNFVLSKRLDLLGQVRRLAESLNISADVAYTCETASYFFLYHILSRWEEYMSKLGAKETNKVMELFPFSKFFEDAPQPLFRLKSFEEDLEIAKGCYRHIKKIFTQLDEFKAFEMLRNGGDRSNYLLVREAKIIAMTCTHAALKRKELVEIGFQYDNILMEESAQILEIETFIPLLLQNPEHGHNRLKRWIMIGDHHQLPPVIKNMAFQKFSNMEQSLFTRFVRLGVPTVDLDAQGRARSSLCTLYRWRYQNLGDLPHVLDQPEYHTANAGFRFDYQLIDVQDFNGVGESEPVPHFYQNLAEAEYVVGTFMYMRLLGYPAEKITILTTYNGQKHLIRDVISQRCASNPFIGEPHKVTTVDKFQGQQNDFILLSLVRTKTVGHLRDVRRLVVAMSRARLGFYVFARTSLFRNCYELTPSFDILLQRPEQLHLYPDDPFPSLRKCETTSKEPFVIQGMSEMVQFVYHLYQKKVDELRQKEEPAVREEVPEEVEEVAASVDSLKEAEKMPAEEGEKAEKEEEESELGFEKLTEDDTGVADKSSLTDEEDV